MAARNRVVSAGGGGQAGPSSGANDQPVAVFYSLSQLVGEYVYTDVTTIPQLNQPLIWVKVDYI